MATTLRDAAQALLDKLDGRRSFGVELLAAEFSDERRALRAALAAPDRAQPAGDAPVPVVATWRERVKHLDRPTDFAERNAAVEEARDLRWALEEAYSRIASIRTEWGAEVAALTAQARHAEDCLEAAKARIADLDAKLNTPQLHNFAEAVVLEAGHQRERWTDSRDVGKQPSDWFWLVAHLAGKALHAAMSGNKDKTAHHTVSTAAALANWHAFVTGEYTDFRPGIDPVARGIEPATEPAGVFIGGAGLKIEYAQPATLDWGDDAVPPFRTIHVPDDAGSL